MSHFHDVVFVPRLPFGVNVASRRHIDVVALSSGHETRNSRTAETMRRYTIPVGTRPMAEIRAILAFFEARGGPLHAFRFRDPVEPSTAADGAAPAASDVQLGIGDGAQARFQLRTASGRVIRKPEPSSVAMALDGSVLDPGSVSVDPATGIVALSAAPAPAVAVTGGCVFDVPVRFENQSLQVMRADADSGSLDDLVLTEVIA
ncbi:MAG: TIGR02217 family protein [Roseitalea sp.]|jgi:uncharacterized protein (TIGR02217 family)|nr:TIGR02217 family protein [Roseitalea sp.]MBO6720534.1 TIGR02217 family protein [Roseitalea sp.]MBO6743681.1 TIGR02217 family protein [Roseitalea sp.]